MKSASVQYILAGTARAAAAPPPPSHSMDLFTNRLLWLGASVRALSLRGSGCRNLALRAFMNKSHTPQTHSDHHLETKRQAPQSVTYVTGTKCHLSARTVIRRELDRVFVDS